MKNTTKVIIENAAGGADIKIENIFTKSWVYCDSASVERVYNAVRAVVSNATMFYCPSVNMHVVYFEE